MRRPMLFTLALVIGAPTFTSVGRAEDEPAKETLQRALKAVGGLRRLGTLKRPMMWMERGTFYGNGEEGIPFIAQYAAIWPDWYRQEIENAFVITVNGKKAWLSSAAGVQNLAGAQLEDRLKQVRLAWAQYLFPLADKAYTLGTIDGMEVNGRPTVGIKASHVDGGDFKFYFDNETYLLAKTEAMIISRQHGPDPVLLETFFTGRSSYGPSKFKVIVDGTLFFEGETNYRKVAATVDPAHFEAPE